jgi:penicillin-binding protein 1C
MQSRLFTYWQKQPKWKRRTISGMGLTVLFWLLLNLIFPFKSSIQYSPMVFDRDGALLFTKLTPDEKWRLYLEPTEVTPLMEKAILAKEDRWFYYHPGVNPLAVGRALVRNMVAGRRTSGASTITMQVARLLHPKPRTFSNKIAEMFRALQLEYRFSKKRNPKVVPQPCAVWW